MFLSVRKKNDLLLVLNGAVNCIISRSVRLLYIFLSCKKNLIQTGNVFFQSLSHRVYVNMVIIFLFKVNYTFC